MTATILITLVFGVFYFVNKAFDYLDKSSKYYILEPDFPENIKSNDKKRQLFSLYEGKYYENMVFSGLCFTAALVIAICVYC